MSSSQCRLPLSVARARGGGLSGARRSRARVTSDCHFAAQLSHSIPGCLSYSVAVFLKWQSGLSPQAAEAAEEDGGGLYADNPKFVDSAPPPACEEEGAAAEGESEEEAAARVAAEKVTRLHR